MKDSNVKIYCYTTKMLKYLYQIKGDKICNTELLKKIYKVDFTIIPN